ncbi:hypothetical protein LC087_00680 [Bacillus carboniphilus]|uniref:Uncharacterized protein n=1 Tax=Bacillus carboniphilus TaxID=86663 RepID=A0ABY9JWK1_9BACI|nr:hypothetical protein [Bacillus carboniphilus]WLR42795.1 hypothetical protein LC087_00680 [Bacillus carboniphilus]
MRTKFTILNIATGLGHQVIITALSFISRTVFIYTLGIEYLGVNGLFTNILALLSLAESGIGASIMYSLYKPVAENDHEAVKKLMRLYRRAYYVIAMVVLILGISLIPFIDNIVGQTNVENVVFIYILFLCNTVLPYFFMYKISLLNANQKTYITTSIYAITSIILAILRIGILYFTENYYLYLVIELILNLVSAMVLSRIVTRSYPFIKEKVSGRLEPHIKKNIVTNVKAIVLQNIGVYLIIGTDNIIISTFVSIAAVGLYSNYQLIMEICRTFMNQITTNMYHSVGNLVSTEAKERVYLIYKVIHLINLWLYSALFVLLYINLDNFIIIWLGEDFLLGSIVVILLLISFWERGMRNAVTTIKTTSGIFKEDKYAPLIQASINLPISILLVQELGLEGVFLGTFISSLLVPFWNTPYLVYKKVFNLSVLSYFYQYLVGIFMLCMSLLVTIIVCWLFSFDGVIGLFVNSILSLAITTSCLFIIKRKTEEFQYILKMVKKYSNMIPLNKPKKVLSKYR